MNLAAIHDWFRRHRWLLAITIVAVMGYSVGKDRALHENALERLPSTDTA